MMMVADKIENADILYRRVPNQQPESYSAVNGGLQLSASAFNNRPAKPPSVGWARMCNSDPAHTKKILPKLTHKIDVIPDSIKDCLSLLDNPAHTLIVSPLK